MWAKRRWCCASVAPAICPPQNMLIMQSGLLFPGWLCVILACHDASGSTRGRESGREWQWWRCQDVIIKWAEWKAAVSNVVKEISSSKRPPPSYLSDAPRTRRAAFQPRSGPVQTHTAQLFRNVSECIYVSVCLHTAWYAKAALHYGKSMRLGIPAGSADGERFVCRLHAFGDIDPTLWK